MITLMVLVGIDDNDDCCMMIMVSNDDDDSDAIGSYNYNDE